MVIAAHAHARAGLLGNPSDGYFGRTISIGVRDFAARVRVRPVAGVRIVPMVHDALEFPSLEALAEDVQRHGYYGGVRLIKASIMRFANHCRERGAALGDRGFEIDCSTNIPVQVGLAGSSAIVTATFRALMAFHEVEIPETILPGLVLAAEREELGIAAGLQDRVVQVYEGAVYMDFDRAHLEQEGYGRYERLDIARLPPLFVAYDERCAEDTSVPHDDLRARFDRGEAAVVEAMAELAELARSGRDLIVAGRGAAIGALMNRNFDVRASICAINPGHRRLVEAGRSAGAAVKFAGSGGAVVGAFDGSDEQLTRLRSAYAAIGATLLIPEI